MEDEERNFGLERIFLLRRTDGRTDESARARPRVCVYYMHIRRAHEWAARGHFVRPRVRAGTHADSGGCLRTSRCTR